MTSQLYISIGLLYKIMSVKILALLVIITSIYTFVPSQSLAQTPTCYSQEYRSINSEDVDLSDSINNNTSFQINLRERITIPIVVHIVYNESNENISDDQVKSQIDALNWGFSHDNKEQLPEIFKSIAGKSDIRFCLANIDPFGSVTNGITRTKTTISNIGDPKNESIKYDHLSGQSAWDPNLYLNIWVGQIGNDLLGYSSFPEMSGLDRDGIVIDTKYFGTIPSKILTPPYIFGKTTIHEVGHYLGLCHLSGCSSSSCDVDDLVEDTPNQSVNYLFTNCPTHPQISCESVDMFMNYMSLAPDPCIWTFTKGQIQRMMSELRSKRNDLINSNSCNPYKVIDYSWLKKLSCSYQRYNNGITLDSEVLIAEDLFLNIYNISGQLVHHTNIKNKYIVKINQPFRNGIYILYFYNANIQYFKKLYLAY